jgi:hypothetical protein
MAELVVGGFTADAVAANRYWTSSALDRNRKCLSSPARSQVTPRCLDQITPACQSEWFPGLSEAGACSIATLRRSVGSQLPAWRDVSVKPQMDEAALFNKASESHVSKCIGGEQVRFIFDDLCLHGTRLARSRY